MQIICKQNIGFGGNRRASSLQFAQPFSGGSELNAICYLEKGLVEA